MLRDQPQGPAANTSLHGATDLKSGMGCAVTLSSASRMRSSFVTVVVENAREPKRRAARVVAELSPDDARLAGVSAILSAGYEAAFPTKQGRDSRALCRNAQGKNAKKPLGLSSAGGW